MCDDLSLARRLEDAGAPMLVMHSLFQEQIELQSAAMSHGYEQSSDANPEASSYLPSPKDFAYGPDEYLEQIQDLKIALRIPVVASLNGQTPGGWMEYAAKIEQAGADALELNIYNPGLSLEPSSAVMEQQILDVVASVRRAVKLPLAVKLSPNYLGLPHFVGRLSQLGVNAVVLFNRFYQADFDIEHLTARRDLQLSTSVELLPRLRAVAALFGRVKCDLAITGGVHTAEDVIKATMAGAQGIQMVSALLENGPQYLRRLLAEIQGWLETHEDTSLSQMRGSMSLLHTPNASAFERGNYMKILHSWEFA